MLAFRVLHQDVLLQTGLLVGPEKISQVNKLCEACQDQDLGLQEGTAANQRRLGSEGHRFKTPCHQGLFTEEPPLKNVPLLLCSVNTISIHVKDVWVD